MKTSSAMSRWRKARASPLVPSRHAELLSRLPMMFFTKSCAISSEHRRYPIASVSCRFILSSSSQSSCSFS